MEHENTCSPVWMLLCLFKSPLYEKDLWQILQEKGFSSEWVPLTCISILCFLANDFWQITQENGFSPVWILMCCFKLPNCENLCWQILQKNAFSSELVSPCFLKVYLFLNASRPRPLSDENVFSPERVKPCFSCFSVSLDFCWTMSHEYVRSSFWFVAILAIWIRFAVVTVCAV